MTVDLSGLPNTGILLLVGFAMLRWMFARVDRYQKATEKENKRCRRQAMALFMGFQMVCGRLRQRDPESADVIERAEQIVTAAFADDSDAEPSETMLDSWRDVISGKH